VIRHPGHTLPPELAPEPDLFDADHSLGSYNNVVLAHSEQLDDGLCLQHVEVNIVQNLESEGLLQRVGLELHGETSEPRRATLSDLVPQLLFDQASVHVVDHLAGPLKDSTWDVAEPVEGVL